MSQLEFGTIVYKSQRFIPIASFRCLSQLEFDTIAIYKFYHRDLSLL